MTTSDDERVRIESLIDGRADAAIKRSLPQFSRAEIARLFASKRVRRSIESLGEGNGRALRAGDDVNVGELLEVALDASVDAAFAPANPSLALRVVFESDALVVVNKQPGLPSHPLDHHDSNSMLSAVNARFPEVASAGPNPREGGLLHRLDTHTGGALAFARTRSAYDRGRDWFSSSTDRAERAYLALITGERDVGTRVNCEAPIAHHRSDRTKMIAVDPADNDVTRHRGQPKAAKTAAIIIARGNGKSLALAHAVGGRRHQVRVHLAHVGAPLVGDELYGGSVWPEADFPNQHALWACALRFPGANRDAGWVLAPPFGAFATTMASLGPQERDATDQNWWSQFLNEAPEY